MYPLVSNWILMSCQPHWVTSGQSNSGHKHMHISKLFSYIYIYKPFVKSIHKTNHFTNIICTRLDINQLQVFIGFQILID